MKDVDVNEVLIKDVDEYRLEIQTFYTCDGIHIIVYYGKYKRKTISCIVAKIIEDDKRFDFVISSGNPSFCDKDSFVSLLGLTDEEIVDQIDERIAELEHKIRSIFSDRVDTVNQFRRVSRILGEK